MHLDWHKPRILAYALHEVHVAAISVVEDHSHQQQDEQVSARHHHNAVTTQWADTVDPLVHQQRSTITKTSTSLKRTNTNNGLLNDAHSHIYRATLASTLVDAKQVEPNV